MSNVGECRPLRLFVAAVFMSACSCDPMMPPDDSSGGGDTTKIGQPGDPHTIILKNNTTGETTHFIIHEDTSATHLVMGTPDDEDDIQTRVRLDRADLANLDVRDLPDGFVALEHVEENEDHPGTIGLLQAEAPSGTVTHSIEYVDADTGIDFDITAVVDATPLDAQSQIATGTVIIVVVSIAAGVCLTELAISVLKTDCNQNCRTVCDPRGVRKCALDVNFGVQTGPFKVGCFTNCDTECNP